MAEKNPSAVGATLAKDKFRIKFHSVFFQQVQKLRLKTHFLVTRSLISDVPDGRALVFVAQAFEA